ncbi:small nuclear RNA activating complex, polypeptide 3 [Apophysomyces ossiformis]|uniref:Small nuclear RNA activating complex, polypeptide 3 n=1 Tax=Apophysomyces ossiformis TaxID=679940 RepID=A0A8H7ENK1_9FUNG|nr:small nuclear RNA activating complex, polypeptide 3 [Apophysomyces ossiformis]
MSDSIVKKFQREASDLLRAQKDAESTINFRKLKRKFADTNFEISDDLTSSTETFLDPTFFALMKQYEDAQVQQERKRRLRREGQIVSKKPQAKDVLRNRILDKDDEQTILQMETNDLGPDQYINPCVPKKRQYLAPAKRPTFQISPEQVASSRDTSTSNPSPSSATASQQNIPIRHTPPERMEFTSREQTPTVEHRENGESAIHTVASQQQTHTTSASNEFTEGDAHRSHTNGNMNPSLQDLALPPSFTRSNDDDDSQYDSAEDELDDDFQFMEHPDIPRTELMRTFLTVSQAMNSSPLKVLNRANMVELLPRQRILLAGGNCIDPRESGKETDTSSATEQGRDLRSSSPEEVILSIAIYHPKQHGQRLQEFEVLGSQSLTDLRDAMYCINDFAWNADHKDRSSDGAVINTPRKKLSSSYMFIDDVFYVDSRAEEEGFGPEPDASAIVREWVMQNERYTQPGLTQYTKKKMHDFKFEDLNLSIGAVYLLAHQDGCHHPFMVRDIRLHGKDDLPNENDYPRMVYNWSYKRYKCSMCGLFPAR